MQDNTKNQAQQMLDFINSMMGPLGSITILTDRDEQTGAFKTGGCIDADFFRADSTVINVDFVNKRRI